MADAGAAAAAAAPSETAAAAAGATAPPTNAADIRRLMDFYFGAANLRRDKFLRNRIESGTGGWVDVSVLLTFNKLKQLAGSVEDIVAALQAGESEVLELDADKKRVRAVTRDLPKLSDAINVSVHVAGFPATATLEEISAELEKAVGAKPVYIKMRRDGGKFLGDAFVEFESKEAADKLRASTELPEGRVVSTVEAYREKMEASRSEKLRSAGEAGRDAAAGSAGAGGASGSSGMSGLVPGSIVFVDGLDAECTREALKECVPEGTEKPFAEYEKGGKSAHLNFKTAEGAAASVELLKAKFPNATVKVLEGEEYEKQAAAAAESRRKSFGRGGGGGDKRRGGGGGGGGGRGGGNKRQRR